MTSERLTEKELAESEGDRNLRIWLLERDWRRLRGIIAEHGKFCVDSRLRLGPLMAEAQAIQEEQGR